MEVHVGDDFVKLSNNRKGNYCLEEKWFPLSELRLGIPPKNLFFRVVQW